jgi:hypothetical protein
MTEMELKGSFHNLIARIEDLDLLRELFALCVERVKKIDTLTDMPAEAIADLERAIEESYDESDLIDNESVMIKARQWLNG